MNRTFELQGHRGARGLFPENTLEGFAATLAIGVDSLELDVAITSDGVAVVTHDPALNQDIARTADGAWLPGPGPAIRALSLAELAAYDVGRLRPASAYAALYPGQAPHDGARIPRLEDLLALAAAAGVVADVELKTLPDRPDLTVTPAAMAEAVMACVAAVPARLAVRSFDWRGLRYMRERHPAVPLAYLTSPETVREAALRWDVATAAGRIAFLRHGLRAPFVYGYWCGDTSLHAVWEKVPRERHKEFWQYLYGNMHTPSTLRDFWVA
ncbi:MAG: hypothetical protein J0H91_11865 [Rhodospirillales bacterium]|nr:hypothetical protein [Rhodospirillales bacterium]